LHSGADDGNVVVMARRWNRLSVQEYFELPETMRPMELVHGIVREPPAPRYGHQSIVTRLTMLLAAHVEAHGLGRVCVSPVDVVLDEALALVVQPDLLFISRDRLGLIDDRIWGAPDLVVEVLSPRTALRDRTIKLGWYRRYGVKECWLVNRRRQSVEVHDLQTFDVPQEFSGERPIRSWVLREWALSAARVFD
jgi:Uma2 family endonuclease